MNQWRPLYFTACYPVPENTTNTWTNKHAFQFLSLTHITYFLSETFSPTKNILHNITHFSLCRNFSLHTVYSVLTFFPAGTFYCTQCTLYLHFSLQELFTAHSAFCTYIFPCRNFPLHTVHSVITFFPAGTFRCTRHTLYLHFSLQELFIAHDTLCTYIFPCRHFSLHTTHSVPGFPLFSSDKIPWLFQYFFHFSLTFIY